ncbi:MAG: putative metalloprotease CJM1_0395 family protein [Verrucomicrobiota bacterium]
MEISGIGQDVFSAYTLRYGNQGNIPNSQNSASAQMPRISISSSELRPGELSPEEKKLVEKLKQRDREVRAHEQAHVSAAGAYARGGPIYTYQTGPDGKSYAIGGEVRIDTSPESTPEKTLEKARVIQAAATAPAEPSPQDSAVAAQAAQMEAQAATEIREKKREEKEENESGSSSNNRSNSLPSLSETLQKLYDQSFDPKENQPSFSLLA